MSQYPQNPPPPHGPGPYGSAALFPDPRTPARQASALMIAIGVIGLLAGICCGAVSLLPLEQMMASQPQPPPLPKGVTIHTAITGLKIVAGVVVVGSAIELLLGIFVRRGSGAVMVMSVVFSVLAAGVLTLNSLSALTFGVVGVPAAMIYFVPVVLLVIQIVLLTRARRAVPLVQRSGAEYQAQYWQHLQQQQLYQQPLPPPPNFQTAPPPPTAAYPGPVGYGQAAYNAPPAGGTQGATATGWQWPATQAPPPPPPAATDPHGDPPNGEGSPHI